GWTACEMMQTHLSACSFGGRSDRLQGGQMTVAIANWSVCRVFIYRAPMLSLDLLICAIFCSSDIMLPHSARSSHGCAEHRRAFRAQRELAQRKRRSSVPSTAFRGMSLQLPHFTAAM